VALPPAELRRYGSDPEQAANLHVPAREGGPWPAVVLVHGGFWRDGFDRATLTPLANDLAARGYVAWNIEYRRVGREGGGWPGTFDDVAAAADALCDVADADAGRTIVLGHSAGGHLALWLAAASRPGERRLRPRGAVSIAGVVDLERAAREGLGSGAVQDLLGGGPDELPERYAQASPAALAPLGVPQLIVHGGRDEAVPPALSRDYAATARAAGDTVELLEFADAGHFDVVDPGHASWAAVADRLPGLLDLD
jgi:acetyl esterase/lipase